jgi:phosphoglycolate phosphatase-like HAD superfamily hydrolase
MRHLVLFDIDGTLLRCGAQVRPLFVGALESAFGSYAGLEGYDFGGRTDPRIAFDLVQATGLTEREILPRLPEMRRQYLERLEEGLRRERMRLLPGVVELLERLLRREDITLGLLTGNWSGGAQIKLARFDLNRFFPFGAFGDDAIDRRDLVPVALERAHQLCGTCFSPDRVLVVGDTVRDVDCAQAAGVASLAVATGFTDAEKLREAGADWVFRDLVEAGQEFGWFAA